MNFVGSEQEINDKLAKLETLIDIATNLAIRGFKGGGRSIKSHKISRNSCKEKNI